MKAKHTSSPWIIDDGETMTIRDSRGGMVFTMGWLTRKFQGPRRSPEEVMANARLAIASPDLLVSLKGILANDGSEDVFDAVKLREYRAMARAAIAKAEGKE